MNMLMSLYEVTSIEVSEIRQRAVGGALRTITIESMIDNKPSVLEISLHTPDRDDPDLERKMLEVPL